MKALFQHSTLVIISSILFNVHSVAMAQAKPYSCQYNEDNGEPTALYQRITKGPQDWYSRYQAIQFCARPNGRGSYVLIQEELIHGFKVLNPARALLSHHVDGQGITTYTIADDLDHVVLKVSADRKRMEALGEWSGTQYEAKLKLVWSAEAPQELTDSVGNYQICVANCGELPFGPARSACIKNCR